jgi:hypothetical protein
MVVTTTTTSARTTTDTTAIIITLLIIIKRMASSTSPLTTSSLHLKRASAWLFHRVTSSHNNPTQARAVTHLSRKMESSVRAVVNDCARIRNTQPQSGSVAASLAPVRRGQPH